MRERPVIIPVLRVAGVLALLAAAALCLFAAFAAERVAAALALAGAAAVTGLFLFGFAANLAVLEAIRRHLAGSRDS